MALKSLYMKSHQEKGWLLVTAVVSRAALAPRALIAGRSDDGRKTRISFALRFQEVCFLDLSGGCWHHRWRWSHGQACPQGWQQSPQGTV